MRSNGPNRVLLYAGSDYQKHANDEVICAAMVETAEGIEKLDEIASTPGLDAIYIGPTDLALALGLPPIMDNDEPKHIATVNRILETCKRHKIVAGIHTNSAKFTQRYLDQGFQMVMLVPDRNAMMNYVKAEIGKLNGWSPMTPVAPQSAGGY
jgi:4-hydroxy-2-oxoheptanedioate aldolase